MQYLISPNFTHEKLESPSFEDIVDVFEDRMRNWYFLPVSKLLDLPHCQVAALALLISYFEGIEIYLVGKDSKYKSQEFFTNGFTKVFDISSEVNGLDKQIAEAIYIQARCGFAHDGLFRNRVFFDSLLTMPMLVTWPRKNGVFDTSGQLESIIVNPAKFNESVLIHFDSYIKKLRNGTDIALRQAFEAAIKLKWGLDEADRIIGMTEEDYHKTYR